MCKYIYLKKKRTVFSELKSYDVKLLHVYSASDQFHSHGHQILEPIAFLTRFLEGKE